MESHLNNPTGMFHTGPGSQFNYSTYIIESDGRLTRKSRRFTAEYLNWLQPRFVRPPGYGAAETRLIDSRAVVVIGPPGSGRRSAALLLLHGLERFSGPLKEFTPIGKDDIDQWDMKIEPGDRMLLDFTNFDEDGFAVVQDKLSSSHAAVIEKQAYMVAVLPYGMDAPFQAELIRLISRIERPSPMMVFRRHLRVDGIKPDDAATAEIEAELRSWEMRRVDRLAGLVRDARAGAPDQALGFWLAQAMAALTAGNSTVSNAVKSIRSGLLRALLLSAAMLHGAHADVVFHAAQRLLAGTDYPDTGTPALDESGLTEHFGELKIARLPDGAVRFDALGYDAAVRAYFWRDHLKMREALRDWVGDLIRLTGLTGGDRQRLVTRFAEQCLEVAQPGDLIWLVERWTSRGSPAWLLPYAAQALELGLRHERFGISFRRKALEWGKLPRLAPELGRVLVATCATVVSDTHPEQALTRLHHLARQSDDSIAAMARTSLSLLTQDVRLRKELFRRLSVGKLSAKEADFELFLVAAEPVVIVSVLADENGRAWVVECWRSMMTTKSPAYWRELVHHWLAASGTDLDGERLLDTLVLAATQAGRALGDLYGIALRWAYLRGPETARRHEIATRLWRKIDAAQGVDVVTG
ncbi:hypothetical protein Acor_33210 [Acrocarpospora corrugata]|uniref:Uncharacterized protein n=1 Tax=Acrocarpospora corrugata TaxID=35763 RepID=A0A5M3VWN4_9ACTN|nr:hypothetical protein [Acrocarpospora corrugata]GES01257.1 hypothetical protein Acor_33210 [Acrocarpospora corrugata]